MKFEKVREPIPSKYGPYPHTVDFDLSKSFEQRFVWAGLKVDFQELGTCFDFKIWAFLIRPGALHKRLLWSLRIYIFESSFSL